MSPDDNTEVPAETVARLRSLCLALPEAHEEQAWRGTRWRIRTRTFAHLLRIDAGQPAAFARAAGTDGPLDVLAFRSSGAELEALGHMGAPFSRPQWAPGVVLRALDGVVDWAEVAELVTESYRVMAPKRLAAKAHPASA